MHLHIGRVTVIKGIGVQLHLANSKTVSSDGTDGEWLVRLMNTLLVIGRLYNES